MRSRTTKERYLDFSGESSLKVVNAYRDKYRRISEVLDGNPRILVLAHRDLARTLSESPGGRGGYSSEQILRALVVMFVEQDSYRQAVIRIENSEFLRHFVRLGVKATMDYSFLSKAYGVISEGTWQAINQVLGEYARREEKIDGEKLRLDTTVVETNIHYPTDSSLRWDGFRTLARLLQGIQQVHPEWDLGHRFHVKKVKRTYGVLIERGGWIVGVAKEALSLAGPRDVEAVELAHDVPIVERIIDQAPRRIFDGEIVPADEKVYSLFEEHTELLKRGKAGKPVEFGHKVLVAQTKEKFIHHYAVLPRRKEDPELLDPTRKAHEHLFGRPPDLRAADQGFYRSMDQIAEREEDISVVSIGKKGRRTREEIARESTEAFKEGQRFRAGSEGSISGLKRAFKRGKCLFKGFKPYAACVGLAVFCHTLVLPTRL